MKLTLLGGPGSGKGTQAELISKALSIPAISTGDIFRRAMREGNEIGKAVAKFINKGLLVPDDIVIEVTRQRLSEEDCKNGYILDGFPRTINQAKTFDRMEEFDYVISLEVSDEVIERRLTGRLVCNTCAKIYHTQYDTTTKPGICDVCGGELVTRDDDKPETVRSRLEIYHRETRPLKDYYAQKGKLLSVDGNGDVEQIRYTILAEVGAEI